MRTVVRLAGATEIGTSSRAVLRSDSCGRADGRLCESLVGNIVTEFMAFAAMFAVIHAVEFNRRAMEDTSRAARLETRLAEARLETLTAQLQPHFLFNTLHAISTLVHTDPEAADRMISRLSDLLRLLGNAFTGRTNIPAKVTVVGQGVLPADVQVAVAAGVTPMGEVSWIRTGGTNAAFAGGFTNQGRVSQPP